MTPPNYPIDLPRLRPLPARRSAIAAALDIGSSKTCCLVGRLRPSEEHDALAGRTHAVEVLGFGLHRSQGIKTGVIVDMDAAEQAIRLAVDSAEREAGASVESVIVNVSCGRLQSETFSASVPMNGQAVADQDIQRVLAAVSAHSVRPGRTVLHSLPIGFALDGHRGIRDPRGMVGDRLGVDLHVSTGEIPPLKNLLLCLERCHLTVEALVATPYASGLSSLVDDESELGCAVVDMGAGTTSIAVFFEGHLIHTDAIALGGHHVTLDVARGLSTRISAAERIKALHGNVLAGTFDSHETITVTALGDEGPLQVSRDQVNRIVRARVEEILELVRDRLQASPVAGRAARRIVLTGGASQLAGTVELARQITGRQVRAGRPLGFADLPDSARGPAFCSAAGLLVYPQAAHLEYVENRRNWLGSHGGYLARVGQWIRDSF